MPDEVHASQQFVQTYGGWIGSLILGGYSLLLRLALREHLKGLAELKATVGQLVKDVAFIKGQLQGRSHR